MKQEQENHDNQNIVPLGSDEIRSILKSQSEAVFEDKNISNNSNFVKKSLIDIALDFKSKQNTEENEVTDDKTENNEDLQEKDDFASEEQRTEEVMLEENQVSDNKTNIQAENEQSTDELEKNSSSDENLDKINNTQSENLIQYGSNVNIESDNQKLKEETIVDTKSDEIIKADDETKQALDSVRDAVSLSMNKREDETNKSLEENGEITNNVSETINNDLENFKNILSSLPNLAEEAIFEVFQNKILEISYEVAGYQIDKMPEKYEEKIKSFLKNINCYQDKITIEVNDKDFEALSKIKNFNKNEDKKVFISNKELSRGDIILNCDGMRYSEKSNYNAL